MNTIELTKKLIQFKSDIIHEDESACAHFLAEYLTSFGFAVNKYEFNPGRTSLVATARGKLRRKLPLGFTGHLDVVPIGSVSWSSPPFEPDIRNGRLYGRGACDMKAGVACLVNAAIKAHRSGELLEDVVLLITAGEETGCEGAFHLAGQNVVPKLGALVVAEPTANQIIVGHKGCLRLAVNVRGKAAHTSMPHLGDNALEKALKNISRILELRDEVHASALLGASTITVSTMQAGTSINVVPDSATFTVCARTVPSQSNAALVERIRSCLDESSEVTVLLDLTSIETFSEDAFVKLLRKVVRDVTGSMADVRGAPYGTDAAALTPATGAPPTVIIGPGAPEVAHQTDEYCDLSEIISAEAIYARVIDSYAML